MNRIYSILLLLLAGGCASSAASFEMATYGEMRTVLREGHTQGRVALAEVARPGTWGLGALADLEGEITVLNGEVFLEVVEDGKLARRGLQESDEATLLVLATVPAWRELPLGPVGNLIELESALGSALSGAGFDATQGPIPIRIEGDFGRVGLHVLDHSCPIANPDGPPPVRWIGERVKGAIVGVYAVGFGGKLTHHGQSTHLHVTATDLGGAQASGHLESVEFDGEVTLFVPEG